MSLLLVNFSYREVATALIGCSNATNAVRAALLQHIIKSQDIVEILAHPSSVKTRAVLQELFFQDINNIATPIDILGICDVAGISRKGYEAIYRTITLGLREKGFKKSILPTPYSITMARKSANREVGGMLGGFRWVEADMAMSASTSFKYNTFNNIYLDLECLERAMIQYYDLTPSECNAKAVFVLKLDECQVVKG